MTQTEYNAAREARVRAIRRRRQRRDFVMRLGILVVLLFILAVLTALAVATVKPQKAEGVHYVQVQVQVQSQKLQASEEGSYSSTGAGPQPGTYEPTDNRDTTQIEAESSLALLYTGYPSRGAGHGRDLFDTLGEEYKITAYTAGYESTGKRPGDKGYGITYSGMAVTEYKTIAADLDVLPLGTKIVIEGINAVFVVEDKGGAVRGKHIDMYVPDLQDAQEWGVQYRRIIILEMGDPGND